MKVRKEAMGAMAALKSEKFLVEKYHGGSEQTACGQALAFLAAEH